MKGLTVSSIHRAALTRGPVIATMMMAAVAGTARAEDVKPITGGTLVYLEQQPHTNLYPPAGG